MSVPIDGETGSVVSVVRAIGTSGSVTIQTSDHTKEDTRIGWSELVTTGQIAGEGIFRSMGASNQYAAVGLTLSAAT
jgi:hypothetical protein